jgi:phosphate transport system substrate-binding protein
MSRLTRLATAIFVLALSLSCTKKEQSNPAAGIQITGAGSTFVFPLMSKWTAEYTAANPNVHVNYQSIGSGGGIRQVSEGTVDFGATDGPMTDEQITSSTVGRILHVPVIMGAAVAAYNLPGFTGELKLTPTVLADIFLGKITQWNDPAIAKANAGAKLPSTKILVAHRADGSGTTYIWTDYLSKVSPEWKSKIGTSTSVQWPAGIGAKGNEGVAGTIQQSPGAIGYIEMIYADQNHIPYASIQNSAGSFVRPSVESVTAAAASAQVPDDFRYSLTNPSGKDTYPIAGTVWLLIPAQPKDPERARAVTAFVKWVLGPGQDLAGPLHYSRLPAELVARVQQSLNPIS